MKNVIIRSLLKFKNFAAVSIPSPGRALKNTICIKSSFSQPSKRMPPGSYQIVSNCMSKTKTRSISSNRFKFYDFFLEIFSSEIFVYTFKFSKLNIQLLTLKPDNRIDCDTALNHDFFWTDPMPEPLTKTLSKLGSSMFEYLVGQGVSFSVQGCPSKRTKSKKKKTLNFNFCYFFYKYYGVLLKEQNPKQIRTLTYKDNTKFRL